MEIKNIADGNQKHCPSFFAPMGNVSLGKGVNVWKGVEEVDVFFL